MSTEVPPGVPGSVPPSMPIPTSAPCPKCGNPYSQPQTWTWWGGFIGPKILHAVKCQRCGATFNGKTGKDLTGAVIIYSVVVPLVALVLAAVCCLIIFGTNLLGSS